MLTARLGARGLSLSRRGIGGLGAILILLALLLAGPSGTAASGGGVGTPTIATDKTDYAPGATVTLTGAGWQRRESVHIVVNDNSGGTWSYTTDVSASSAGAFTTQFQLPTSFVASYLATATGPSSGTATTTFTDSAASLSQCVNGGVNSKKEIVPEPCRHEGKTFENWVNGNANEGKAHWAEDQFIPYRTAIEGLTAGEHTLVIGYQTVHGGGHAIDYLGSFDATETTSPTANALHANKNNPCLDILTGSLAFECTPSEPTSKLGIPEPELKNCATSEGKAPKPITGFDTGRFMKIWGPSGTMVTAMKYEPEVESGTGQCSRTLKISFVVGAGASTNTVVLAWSGHIARGAGFNGWGKGDGAESVSGSPYHMSLELLDGHSQGSQDRALTAAAVAPESTITIIKKTVGGDGEFGYTTTGEGGLPASFNIKTTGGKGEVSNPGIVPGSYTVTESSLPGFTFTSLECTTTGGATVTKSGAQANITVPITGGATVTCTYTNTKAKPELSITKEATPTTYSKVGEIISYKIVATNTGNVTLNNVSVEDKPALENFSCTPSIPATLEPGKSIACTGTHKITQADLDAGKVEDTACTTATGATEKCAGAKVTAEPKPELSITKEANPKTYSHVGETISYKIVATNTGNVTLNNVSVEDKPALENFSCTPSIPATLEPGKSIACTGTHKITQADLDAGKVEDTACTTATGATEKCASAKVTANQTPKLTITKEPSPTTYSNVGEVINYKIVATNTGNVTLSNVFVEDIPALENFSCTPSVPTTLEPGKSITCTGTHKITQADLDAGKVLDTACTSATGVNEVCAPAEVTAEQHPKLGITKTATPTTYSTVGEVISYEIVATNTGNVTLNNVSVTDKPPLEGFECLPSNPATLAPGKSITCTGKHTITQADLDAGKVEDTACAKASSPPGADEPCASAKVTANQTPELTITKEANPKTYSHVGETISYKIVATNTGNVTLNNVSVEDKPALENFSCTPSIPTTLEPGKSITCTGTHKITQADLDAGKVEDTACTTATGAEEKCASAKVTANQTPELTITKEANPKTYSHVGETISYKIVATNTGNVTLNNVSVEDKPALENFSCTPSIPTTLEPGKSITCTGTHKITQADLDAGKVEDTACTTATGAEEKCASAKVTANQTPKLTITKKASPETYTKAGDVITYTIVATNTGNVTLNNVSVEDKPALENFSCTPSIPTTLAPGESVECTGTHTVTQTDLEAGKVEDTACVSATGAEKACASVKLVGPPALTITKTADVGGTPSTVAAAGNPIGFTVTVTSTGASPATNVSMSDPLPSGSGISWTIDSKTGDATCSISGTAPNQTLTCTKAVQQINESFSVHVTSATTSASAGTYKNTATVSATNVAPLKASAEITVYAGCVLGYPTGSAPARSSVTFSESEVLRASAAVRPDGTLGGSIAGPNDRIALWYNDEHALTLGIRQVTVKTSTEAKTPYTVSSLPSNPGHVEKPQVGTTQLGNNNFFPGQKHEPEGFPNDQAGTDTATWLSNYFFLDSGRPVWPALFKTDITGNPANRSGDWQQGGTEANSPNDVFGTWKAAVRLVDKTKSPYGITVTPDADPTTKNNWTLGTGSDTPPGGFASLKNEGYGAEARWNVSALGLEPGHAYRLEFMVHDGDQNKTGGDSGEACMNVVVPG